MVHVILECTTEWGTSSYHLSVQEALGIPLISTFLKDQDVCLTENGEDEIVFPISRQLDEDWISSYVSVLRGEVELDNFNDWCGYLMVCDYFEDEAGIEKASQWLQTEFANRPAIEVFTSNQIDNVPNEICQAIDEENGSLL